MSEDDVDEHVWDTDFWATASWRYGKNKWETTLWSAFKKVGLRGDDIALRQEFLLALICLSVVDERRFAMLSEAAAKPDVRALGHIWSAGPVREYCSPRANTDLFWRSVGAAAVRAVASCLQSKYAMSAENLFGDLLESYAAARKGREAQGFFVSRDLSALLVQIAAPKIGEHVHDPCCNGGELLASVISRQRWMGAAPDALTLTGHTFNDASRRLASMNLLVHGVQPHLTGPSDDTVSNTHTGPLPVGDVVLMNPPFNASAWDGPERARPRDWGLGEPPAHNANFGWLQFALESMRDGGRGVVVMPAAAADSENQRENAIRKVLVEQGVISCIIALPTYLFRETTASVHLWVLSRGSAARSEIMFVDATADCGLKAPTRRVIPTAARERIAGVYHRWLSGAQVVPEIGVRAVVSADEVRRSGYRLNPALYVGRRNRSMAIGGADLGSLWQRLGELEREGEALSRELAARLKDWNDADSSR